MHDRRTALGLLTFASAAPLYAASAADNPSGGGNMMAMLGAVGDAADARATGDVARVLIAGHTTPGDRGSGGYRRVAAQPRHKACFRDGSGTWFELDERVANVFHFGARGDGVTDDGQAFQDHADALFGGLLKARGHYPTGDYAIGDKITLPLAAGGGVIEGDGMCVADPRVPGRPGTKTVLYWSGADGGTMIGGKGNTGLTIRDISFCGRRAKQGPRAGILFHCEQDTSNANGSGVGLMEQVSFVDADVGVQMGAAVSDHNSADWTFIRPTFFNCGTGFVVKHNQGLNYSFLAPSAVACDSLFRMEHGGHFYATNVQAAHCGGIGDGKWMLEFDQLSDNATFVVIDGLRIEQNCRQPLRVIGGQTIIRAYEEAQAPQPCTMVELRGGTLSIEGARLVSHSADAPHFRLYAGAGGTKAALVLDRVHFDAPAFDLTEWVWRDPAANALITLKNCTYGNRSDPLPIADVNVLLAGGPVNLRGRGAGKTMLTIDGTPSAVPNNLATLPARCTAIIDAHVIGQAADGNAIAIFHRRAIVRAGRRPAAAMADAGQTIGADVNPAGWPAPVIVASSGQSVGVRAGGSSGDMIEWAAQISATILPDLGS